MQRLFHYRRRFVPVEPAKRKARLTWTTWTGMNRAFHLWFNWLDRLNRIKGMPLKFHATTVLHTRTQKIMADSQSQIGRLDGKVALITGASSGIGAATAKLFCKLGAEVAITGRKEENLRKTAEECDSYNGKKALMILAELTLEEDTKRVMDETIKHYKKLDILVNNAGIVANGSIETTSLEQYDAVMNINVRSVYHLTMLAVPHLIETKGSIVNVSSVAGMRSFPGVLSYCMSKSAIDQFTHCIALELAPKQVRVNCVNPGVIVTEIHKRGGMDEEKYKEFLDRTKTTHALGRPGNVDEVANCIAFLASSSSSYITGAKIPIDGGRHAMCPR